MAACQVQSRRLYNRLVGTHFCSLHAQWLHGEASSALEPEPELGRSWLVNLFHQQDMRNAAAAVIQRAWRTHMRNHMLRTGPTLAMLEASKLRERAWRPKINRRPLDVARLMQLMIEPKKVAPAPEASVRWGHIFTRPHRHALKMVAIAGKNAFIKVTQTHTHAHTTHYAT